MQLIQNYWPVDINTISQEHKNNRNLFHKAKHPKSHVIISIRVPYSASPDQPITTSSTPVPYASHLQRLQIHLSPKSATSALPSSVDV